MTSAHNLPDNDSHLDFDIDPSKMSIREGRKVRGPMDTENMRDHRIQQNSSFGEPGPAVSRFRHPLLTPVRFRSPKATGSK